MIIFMYTVIILMNHHDHDHDHRHHHGRGHQNDHDYDDDLQITFPVVSRAGQSVWISCMYKAT